ncbi:MAG: LysM peptidoglycan-binding domain-containing protein, partial [Victivallaceae bacterium]
SEYAGDYANAVYHYRTYLELSPNAPDAETMRNFQRLAEEKFYQQLKQRLNDSGDIQDLTRTISTLQQQLVNLHRQEKNYQNVILGYKNFIQSQLTEIDQLKKDKSELVNSQLAMQEKLGQNELDFGKLKKDFNVQKSTNETLLQQLTQQNENVARLQLQLQKINTELTNIQSENIRNRLLQSPQDTANAIMNTPPPTQNLTPKENVSPNATAVKSPPPPATTLPDAATYPPEQRIIYVEVKPSDTLGALAAKYLGSSTRYNEILQDNRDILKSPTDLRPGQRLKIRPNAN